MSIAPTRSSASTTPSTTMPARSSTAPATVSRSPTCTGTAISSRDWSASSRAQGGERLQVKIAPADGYGEYDEELVQRVPRRALKGVAQSTSACACRRAAPRARARSRSRARRRPGDARWQSSAGRQESELRGRDRRGARGDRGGTRARTRARRRRSSSLSAPPQKSVRYSCRSRSAHAQAARTAAERIDPRQVGARVVIAAALPRQEAEAAVRVRAPRRPRRTGAPPPPGAAAAARVAGCGLRGEDLADLEVQVRSSELDGVRGQYPQVQRVEPARVPVVPASLAHQPVIVNAIAARLGKGSVGDLVHAHGAGSRAVDLERPGSPGPAPVGAYQRVAGSLHLRKRGEQLPAVTSGVAKRRKQRRSRARSPGGLGKHAAHREEKLGWLAHHLVDHVAGERQACEQREARERACNVRQAPPAPQQRRRDAAGQPRPRRCCGRGRGVPPALTVQIPARRRRGALPCSPWQLQPGRHPCRVRR